MMVVEIRRRMDVKNAWELKWIGASSLDPSLIASSENAQCILSSSSHCAENSASDTSPRPVHSPACCWASIAAQKHTEKAPQNTHHSALAQIALDSEMNCWHLESRLLLLYTLLLSSAASGVQILDPFLHCCYFSDQSFTILGIWLYTIMLQCRAFWVTTITNN